jgi:HK97 family phage major capsid protein
MSTNVLSSETLTAVEELARIKLQRTNLNTPVTQPMLAREVSNLLDEIHRSQSDRRERRRFDWVSAINGALVMRGAAPIYRDDAAADATRVRSLSPTQTPGQYLVPVIESGEFISQLSLGSTMRKAGATRWPMEGVENLTVPAGITSPTWQFLPANAKQTPDSAFNLGQISFTLKEHRALVQLPQQLFRVAKPALQSLLPTFLSLGAAESEDVALHASATLDGNSPQALLSGAGVTFLNCGGSANGSSISWSDITTMIQTASQNKLPFPWAWFCSPRTFTRLWSIASTTSQLLLGPPVVEGGAWHLAGFPLFLTNSISNAEALGSGSSLSHLVLCHPEHIHIAEDNSIAFEVSNEFGFDAALTTLRIIHHIDTAFVPAAGFTILRGIA